MQGLKNLIYRGVQLVIRLGSRILIRVLSNLTIEGRENFKNIPDGPLLIIANHKSYYDPVVIAAALPFFSRFNPLRFIAKDEFFQRPLSAFVFKLMGAFPAHQGEGLNKSLELPEKILRENGTVVFFPEGRCVREDKIETKGKIGAAALAERFPRLTVLPVAIHDSYKIGKGRPFVKIFVGAPFNYHDKVMLRKTVDEATGLLIKEISDLYYSKSGKLLVPEKI